MIAMNEASYLVIARWLIIFCIWDFPGVEGVESARFLFFVSFGAVSLGEVAGVGGRGRERRILEW